MPTTLAVQRTLCALDDTLRREEVPHIRRLVTAAGIFRPEEISVACELAEARLNGTDASYHFLFARDVRSVLGYACYGAIPLAEKSFDLYWIVVFPEAQGRGLGTQLLRATEAHVRNLGGRRVYAETSGTTAYFPAQRFYRSHGFTLAANLPDFYRDGDAKLIFQKRL